MNRKIRMVTYFKGDGSPMLSLKTNRNDLCECGSGKKQKKCCGAQSKLYSSKPKKQELSKNISDVD